MKVTYLQQHCGRAGQEVCVRDLEDGECCLVWYKERSGHHMWKRVGNELHRSINLDCFDVLVPITNIGYLGTLYLKDRIGIIQ